jgi:hypothetical protein
MNASKLVIGHWYYDVEDKDRLIFVEHLSKSWFKLRTEDGFLIDYYIEDLSRREFCKSSLY